jgi:hypothetical protein
MGSKTSLAVCANGHSHRAANAGLPAPAVAMLHLVNNAHCDTPARAEAGLFWWRTAKRSLDAERLASAAD